MSDNITKYSFGWKPDPVDLRDYKFKLKATEISPVDLRSKCTPVRDQGALGACTAFATTALVEFVRDKQHLKSWQTSPLFTYYATRKIGGTVDQDSGAYNRDALKSTVDYGVTPETQWPYVISDFTKEPPQQVWAEAIRHQALEYQSVSQTEQDVLGCLSEGYPFTFGSYLYSSFYKTAITGVAPMPDTQSETLLGGHCMLAVGWEDTPTGKYIIVRNSWGESFGDKGYFRMPLQYLLDKNLSADFWTIRKEEVTAEDTSEPSSSAPTTIWKQPWVYVAAGTILLLLIYSIFKR